ncbi:MAG: hypothetical protein WC241_00240 [Candidatus Paceibacterota bacterium]|jgi:hypothetical protein
MKQNKKILIGVVVVLVIIVSLLLIRENRPDHIIQARLIDSGNLTISPIDGLYSGILTFQNLKNHEKHTYFICLKDLSSVRLNEVYNLPVNYYVPHGGPNESMQTNGCNFSLNLSNKN